MPGWSAAWAIRRLSMARSAGCRCFSGTGVVLRVVVIVGAGRSATLGVVLYEVRNTQLYDYAVRRSKELEARLGAVSIYDPSGPGGLFTERPGRDIRVFGLALAGHERGLAIVYGAALAGWSYLVAWGALRALDVGSAQKIGGIVGIVIGVLALLELLRIDARSA